MELSWHQIFITLITLAVGLAGAPITQLIKNLLGKIAGEPVEDRWALLLAGVMAGILAVAEMLLTGALKLSEITLASFPQYFFAVFTVATVYFQWFKNSDGKLGAGFLLRK